jgi:iron complex outermembrane receptor protein
VQQTVLPPGQATTISILSNGARSTLKGFEVDGQLVFNRYLRAQYGYSYLDAKYDRYDFTPTVSFSGNHLPRAPKTTANLALVADIPAGSGTLSLRGAAQYTSSFFWDPNNAAIGVKEPSHVIADASADFHIGNYTLGVFAKNLTGERTRVQLNNINPTRLLEAWGNRRVLGVRLSADW